MGSLKELNRICQKADYKKQGNWMVRTFLRDAALPCTWLLLQTKITANQVTLLAILVGLLSCLYLALPGGGPFLIAVFLLQLWYYLDHVDGQIARYRGTASLTGRFFDFLMHHIIHAAVFFALGCYAWMKEEMAWAAIWGFVIAFSMTAFNMLHDIKSKTFIEKLLKTPGLLRIQPRANGPHMDGNGKTKPSRRRRLFSFAHKLCEIHVVMNLLTVFALTGFFFDWPVDFRMPAFLLYGFLVPVIAVAKLTYIIIHRQIDTEFAACFLVPPVTAEDDSNGAESTHEY